MKAMVLAAGFGTRLGTLTKECPKCLIPVAGKPIIQHVIEQLRRAGVSSIAVNLHYLAPKVEEFFKAIPDLNVDVTFSHEAELLGTGGGLLKLRRFFQDESQFLMVNADIFCDFPLERLVHRQREADGALATLLTMEREDSSYLLFDDADQLVGLENKAGVQLVQKPPRHSRKGFCGIQVMHPKIFEFMEGQEGKSFSIIDTYLAAAGRGERIGSVSVAPHFWIDMGTPEQLRNLENYLTQKRAS